ncbi:phosphoribosyl pyrophosphate synthase-associated protein 1, partial [Dermacentor silvarum]|uniref:phosphoribosyl pyrophosphate synthase-associated protein 1 n=1 Tax=Dermacentor silvarum TaxID=543639 RepID=UPI002100A4FF
LALCSKCFLGLYAATLPPDLALALLNSTHHHPYFPEPKSLLPVQAPRIYAQNVSLYQFASSLFYCFPFFTGIAVIHGEQKESESDMVDGRYSPPTVLVSGRTMEVGLDIMPVPAAKEKPPIYVVGDVGGRIAIMVDDMVDDVQSFVVAAEVLKERGAYKIYVLATHGLLSSDAPQLIENSPIDEVVVTNTVPHEVQKMQCHKIKTVDISVLLSEAIRRIHHKESMSYLFRNVTLED